MATNDEILLEIKEVSKKVDKLNNWQGEINERCTQRGETINGIHSTLYHNDTGLVYKVKSIEDCKTGKRVWQDFWMYVLKALVTIGTIALIALIIKVAIHMKGLSNGQ